MKQLYEDLWQSDIYSSGMLNTHAYFLQLEQGNILFYNTFYEKDLAQIETLGGIRYQILTHRDEVGDTLAPIKERFGSQLATGVLEVPFASKVSDVDIVFPEEDTQLGDIEVFHTPGHTDGSTSYLYRSPHGKTYLFSGDSFFLWDGVWTTFVLKNFGGTKEAMVESLKKLRPLGPDVVLSSGFVGDMPYGEFTSDQWLEEIDRNIAKLESRDHSPFSADS